MDAIAEAVAWATCTSDPHQVHAGLPAGLILGHEVVARLVKVGSMVKDFKVGDIVCVGAVTPDWTWPNCQDNIHQDANGAAQGMNWCVTENGTFAERFRIRQVDCNATYIPKGLTYEHALMASDMVTTGFHGVEMAHVTGATRLSSWASAGGSDVRCRQRAARRRQDYRHWPPPDHARARQRIRRDGCAQLHGRSN